MVILQINDKCGAIARGELYREPLEDFFENNDLGEVSGGGTLLQENGQPEYCELELSIKDTSDEVINKLKKGIDSIVPKGSILFLENNKEMNVGILEGVAVNLNHSKAPENLLDEIDFQEMWENFDNAIGEDGEMHDEWDGNETFTLYYYGLSAQKIIDNMNKELKEHKIKEFVSLEIQPTTIKS